jgi:hypothetical protein
LDALRRRPVHQLSCPFFAPVPRPPTGLNNDPPPHVSFHAEPASPRIMVHRRESSANDHSPTPPRGNARLGRAYQRFAEDSQ